MNLENGPSPFEEARIETEEEIEKLNEEINSMSEEEKTDRLQKIRDYLKTEKNIETANMEQKEIIDMFVRETAKELLNGN